MGGRERKRERERERETETETERQRERGGMAVCQHRYGSFALLLDSVNCSF